jgi:hypothetical protein
MMFADKRHTYSDTHAKLLACHNASATHSVASESSLSAFCGAEA